MCIGVWLHGHLQCHLQKLGTRAHTFCTWLLILPANELEGGGSTPSTHPAPTALHTRHFECVNVMEKLIHTPMRNENIVQGTAREAAPDTPNGQNLFQ